MDFDNNPSEHDLDKLVRFIKKKINESSQNNYLSNSQSEYDTEPELISEEVQVNYQLQEDYDNVVKMIVKLEEEYVKKKLTSSKIKTYQKKLDKIYSNYKYADNIPGLLSTFCEFQALIYIVQENTELASNFLYSAVDFKLDNQDFISNAVTNWYSDNFSNNLNNANDKSNKKIYFSKKKVIFITVFTVVILGIAISGPLSDYLTIKNANPAMIQLAQQAGMSRRGELLFLRTNPQLVSDSQMASVCSSNTAANNNNGFIEEGCYDSITNRIYIRQVPSDLYNLEVSTAAYEMLHPVYIAINQSNQSSNLNQAIEDNYQANNDSFLNSQVANFAKTEPGARDLELFSLLGTGYSNLTKNLANYYKPYFNNIQDTITANNQVNQLFQNDLSQLTQLSNTLSTDNNNINSIYNDANTAYNNSVSWANAGNSYENSYNYNIYSQDYNIYSQDITDYNNTVDQYNQILQSYKDIVVQFNGQQFNQQNTIQSQQQAQ